MGKRELTTHKVNGLNESLQIQVLDDPGQGNACHQYLIVPPIPADQLPDTLVCYGGYPINFQNGPIKEFGVNGISNEALLAIVRDRLEGFQSGPYACEANKIALESIMGAMDVLHARTKERVERGVEGTNVV
jgi:hypothetical protein